MKTRNILAVFGAAVLTLQPSLASAQQACLTEDEVSAIGIYAVPSLVRSMQLKCAGRLSSDGFLARQGAAFSSRYAARQNDMWPRAKSGLIRSLGANAGQQEAEILALVATLPDEHVRPLVDELITQEISAQIEPTNCSKIERIIETLAPIEPPVAGALIGAIAAIAATEEMPVCGREKI